MYYGSWVEHMLRHHLIAILPWFAVNFFVFENLFASEVLKFSRDDGTIIDYYLVSTNKMSESLLVLIQGSDCNSVSHNKRINDAFIKVLPEADILTVEKYGINDQLEWSDDPERVDCPEAYIERDSLEQRVQDYSILLNSLQERGQYKNIVLIGGSEGAVVANILASRLHYLHATIALNSGAPKFLDDVLHNIASQAQSPEAYSSASKEFIGFYQHIMNSEPFKLNISGHGYRWWRNMFEVNQMQVLAKINTPLLLVQSGNDKNVSAGLAQELAKSLIKDSPNITFKLYKDLDHSFMLENGNDRVDIVIKDIKLWLQKLKT
jgi:pimeloyl-ACP methyl ester carboxylesterase